MKEQAILDTAWRLLSEKPMASITVDELAAGAGISRSSFYFYFSSQSAVIRALAERTRDELTEAVLVPLGTALKPRDAVRTVVENVLARWRTHGPLLRAMDDLAERDAELAEFWRSISTQVVDRVAEAIEAERRGGRAPYGPDAHDLAWSLMHLLWRVGHQLSLGMGPPGGTDFVETLTTMAFRAVYSPL